MFQLTSQKISVRMDYTAYGEDIGAGTGLRTLAQGFTGLDGYD